MVIDKTIKAYSDVPFTLEGEVLLDRPLNPRGAVDGFLTCTVDDFIAMKNADQATRAAKGWDQYNSLLDSADEPTLRAAVAAINARKNSVN